MMSVQNMGFKRRRIPYTECLYTSRKAWMNQNIWAHEMKELNKKLGIENRKILLLLDNCSSHKELQLENIKFLYFLPGATATVQVQIHKF